MVKIDSTDFVLADLPGLIEGAHDGIGLGDKFLGHAERCNVILHLIDGTEIAIAKTYKTIRGELEAYGHGLGDKPEIVALNKVDAIAKPALAKKRAALEKACGHKVFAILRRVRRRHRRRAARSGQGDRQAPRAEEGRGAEAGMGAVSDPLAFANLVVVKVGSALLVDAETGELRRYWLKSLCADVAELKRAGKNVLLVSSGAIALGRRALKLKSGPLRLKKARPPLRRGRCVSPRLMPISWPARVSSRRRFC